MIRFLRRLLTIVRAPRPLVGRFDGDVARYLQRRAAQAARRHPHTPPPRRGRPMSQEGFQ